MSLNLLLPTFSWIFVFNDSSPALNECLDKGYLNFFSTKSQLCSNENQLSELFCWIWLSFLGILMSNVVDLFCIFYIFKDIIKATAESRSMLSNQAFMNRKRYYQTQYHSVANSRPGYYCKKVIVKVKFLLHKQSKNPWGCY